MGSLAVFNGIIFLIETTAFNEILRVLSAVLISFNALHVEQKNFYCISVA
jgi:hypothetical protein